jgi:hypothetical protein
MAVTSRGKGWERSHSIWIAWTFFAVPWMSFFYIGIRVKHRRWIAWGALYSAPFVLSMITTESPANSLVSQLTGFLLLVAWIGGIIHAFRARKEYLLRLEAAQRSRVDTDTELRQQIQTEYGPSVQGSASGYGANQVSTAAPSPNLESSVEPPSQSTESSMPSAAPQRPIVDLNNSSE